MFNVYLNDGNEIPKDDSVCYIIAKDGVYLRKNLGMISSTTKVDGLSFLQGKKIIETAELNIKKIPSVLTAQMMAFFKDVCKEHHGSEAIILFYYNQETGEYKFHAPPQIVSGGSCDFKRDISMTKNGFNLVGDAHTHGNGSAFHSGIDDADEKTGVDGLHVTFGHVTDDKVTLSVSVTVNGKRFIVEPEKYFEDIIRDESNAYTYSYPSRTYRYVNGKMQEDKKPAKKEYDYRRIRFYLKDQKDAKYPKEWMENVEYRYAKKSANYYDDRDLDSFGYGQFGGFYGSKDWTSYWDSYSSRFKPIVPSRRSPLNVGPVKEGISFDGEHMCKKCPFRLKVLQIQEKELKENKGKSIDEVDFLAKDDGSLAYEDEVDIIVEDNLTNDDFLNSESESVVVDEEKIPKNLKGKPKSWILEFFRSLK